MERALQTPGRAPTGIERMGVAGFLASAVTTLYNSDFAVLPISFGLKMNFLSRIDLKRLDNILITCFFLPSDKPNLILPLARPRRAFFFNRDHSLNPPAARRPRGEQGESDEQAVSISRRNDPAGQITA